MRLVSRVRFALLNLFTSSCTNHLKMQSKRVKVIVMKDYSPQIACFLFVHVSIKQQAVVFFFYFQSPLFRDVQLAVGPQMPAEGIT